MNNIKNTVLIGQSWNFGLSKIKRITEQNCKNISYFLRIDKDRNVSVLHTDGNFVYDNLPFARFNNKLEGNYEKLNPQEKTRFDNARVNVSFPFFLFK